MVGVLRVGKKNPCATPTIADRPSWCVQGGVNARGLSEKGLKAQVIEIEEKS